MGPLGKTSEAPTYHKTFRTAWSHSRRRTDLFTMVTTNQTLIHVSLLDPPCSLVEHAHAHCTLLLHYHLLQTSARGFQARGYGGGRPGRGRSADRVPRPRRGRRVHRELRRADADVALGRSACAVRSLLHATRIAEAVRRVGSYRRVSYDREYLVRADC